MPFHLINAPAASIDLISRVVRHYFDKFMVVFVDDNLIYSMGRDEHTVHLRTVLQTLREHQLYGKLKKCKLRLEEMVFLNM